LSLDGHAARAQRDVADAAACTVACHLGEGRPVGNKSLSSAGQMGDLWHGEGQPHRAVGQGRRPAPRPHPLRRQDRAERRPQRFIVDGKQVPLDDSRFKPCDEVAPLSIDTLRAIGPTSRSPPAGALATSCCTCGLRNSAIWLGWALVWRLTARRQPATR
jgi:hypothetical protein